MKQVQECKAKECHRASRARGYCPAHYERWRQGCEDMDSAILPRAKSENRKPRNMNPPKYCGSPKCNRLHERGGYCDAHYRRAREGKPVNYAIGEGRKFLAS